MPEGTGTVETGDVRLGLVLGGGGVAGVAWHTGLLLGLADEGIDLTSADRIVGTSAGATVAAQVGGGATLDDLFRRQIDPDAAATEIHPELSVADLWERMAPIYADAVDDEDRRRRLGRLALDAATVAEPVRRQVIAARLDGLDWQGDRVAVVAVEATTGARRVFDRASGVDLVDAVTASCAVPGVWPTVTIEGSRYLDGGIWSMTNADLAVGCDRVVVLAPFTDEAMHTELAGLGAGVRSVVVTPDDASLGAFGADVLDPAVRGPSARAGRTQGHAEAGRVAGVLAG